MTGRSTVSLCYRLLDYPVVVTASDDEMRAAVESILRGFPQHEPAGDSARYALARDDDGGWCVEAHGTRTCHRGSLTDALLALEWYLFSDMLAFRNDRFHLHGAALCAPAGTTSLLVLGAQGAGKTTLALALMARGFLPFADDIVFLEPDTLAPRTFRRAFHVDASTRALVEGLPQSPPGQFDEMPPGYFMPSRWAQSQAPVRAIFFPTVRAGETPSVTMLSVADATATLLPFSSTLGQAPRLALAAAARLTGQATCYALASGDLEATADLVATVTAASAGRLAEPPHPAV